MTPGMAALPLCVKCTTYHDPEPQYVGGCRYQTQLIAPMAPRSGNLKPPYTKVLTPIGGEYAPPECPRCERTTVNLVMAKMLRACTGDGSSKRQKGIKPAWYDDPTHEAAIFSHMRRWKSGEKRDPDSGAHPMTHVGWRSLAIAYMEINGAGVNPDDGGWK